jgi:non-heme chloroperoxidase
MSNVGAWRDDVTTESGVRLALRVAGPSDAPPVVLLHGWAQSAEVWTRQLLGPLNASYRMVAVDLRGHGDSDVPADGYDSADAWAADLSAVLAHVGRPAVLVGWSYGGLVITDYLRRHGTADVAGLALVGAITEIGRGHPGGRVGPVMRAALPAALSADPDVAGPALSAFVAGMSSAEDTEWLLDESLRVPAFVRAALFDRDVASADVLAGIDVPTLIVHGRQDAVVDPSAASYAAGLIPGVTLTWLDSGHLPFVDNATEFDTALAAHVGRCFGRSV